MVAFEPLGFAQIHRSWVVNLRRVRESTDPRQWMGGQAGPTGRPGSSRQPPQRLSALGTLQVGGASARNTFQARPCDVPKPGQSEEAGGGGNTRKIISECPAPFSRFFVNHLFPLNRQIDRSTAQCPRLTAETTGSRTLVS